MAPDVALPRTLSSVRAAGRDPEDDIARVAVLEPRRSAPLRILGLGFPPDMPTWGRILFDARNYLDIAPHWAIFPGLCIFLIVLSINYIGDGLRDALDPRRKI